MAQEIIFQETLVSDEHIAKALCVSKSWVRKQRFLRRRSEPHFLTIDAISLGGLPRYRRSDVEVWLASLCEAPS